MAKNNDIDIDELMNETNTGNASSAIDASDFDDFSNEETISISYDDLPQFKGKAFYPAVVDSFEIEPITKGVNADKGLKQLVLGFKIIAGTHKGSKIKKWQQVTQESQYYTGKFAKACGLENKSKEPGKNSYDLRKSTVLNKYLMIEISATQNEEGDTVKTDVVDYRQMKDSEKEEYLGI